MALGGGKWISQNKKLPGSYINFVSAARATAALSDRGTATIPIVSDWGRVGEVVEVTAADFQTNSKSIFGYDFTHPKMKKLRDFFKKIRTGYIYRLGSGGTEAENDYAKARYAGERGNALKVIVAANVDDSAKFTVTLLLDNTVVDTQTAANAAELAGNDFVTWKDTPLALTPTAGTPLSGGASPVITNANHQSYLEAIEPYSFNAIGCPSDNAALIGLYTAFTRRMREEMGINFQLACYNPGNSSDFEGVVDVLNKTTGDDADWSAVYWVTGLLAGTNVNQSATNQVYDGEFIFEVSHSQRQLEDAVRGGKFAFHRVGSDVRVLSDINSLVSLTAEKGEDFRQNQTIRVIDQIGNDIAVLFNTKYLGVVPNDEAGRIGLWSDIVQHHADLQTIRAIENFSDSDVTVGPGNTKRSVVVNDRITPVNAMEQLYMTCVIA
jgi:hypothetical protein